MATTLRHGPAGELVHVCKVRIDSDELIDASTTQVVDLVTLPSGAEVLHAYIDNVIAFTDAGSITATTIQVGITGGDVDALVPAFDLFGSTGRVSIAGAGVTGDGATISALFTATGANLGDAADTGLDTGLVDVTIIYVAVD